MRIRGGAPTSRAPRRRAALRRNREAQRPRGRNAYAPPLRPQPVTPTGHGTDHSRSARARSLRRL
eukprot:8739199-Alexandrium_andersonii.AAC.1